MNLVTIIWIVAAVVIVVLVLGLKAHFVWRGHQKRYLRLQSERVALSDDEFCRRAGFDASVVVIVAPVRAKLAQHGRCDPLRIYPEDSFYPHFGLDWDDDVAMVVEEMKLIKGFHQYWFPLEEVHSVGDFVKVILRLKKEAEPDEANRLGEERQG